MRTQLSIGMRLAAIIATSIVAGCASTAPLGERASIAELDAVPFFPQTAFDCGPAALATILATAGVTATPDALVDEVYVEGLSGSLQAELLAATRRHERLPVNVTGGLDGLLAELESGRPVLVLLNLGLARRPVWHYAVVVGFDAQAARLVLRSGEERARHERVSRFLRQWQLADQWAFVATRPAEVPVSASAGEFLRAVVDAESQLPRADARRAYEAALTRWPDDALVLFLAASRHHADQELSEAARLYRRVLLRDPEHAAARNNLAHVLLAQGCREQALVEARRALISATDGPFAGAVEDTLSEIERAPPGAGASCSIG